MTKRTEEVLAYLLATERTKEEVQQLAVLYIEELEKKLQEEIVRHRWYDYVEPGW